MSPAASKVRYRPDIDGLRGVAVTLAILYHLNRSWVPGGFASVDIFFVISGFVVTGSALAWQSGNPFEDMLQFWRRRILRIMPALLWMVFATTLAVAMIGPPYPIDRYSNDLGTGISAILGLANLYLYRIGLDYFGADQSANPFVHMWSLGVEEQFYFAFAVGFIGLIGLIRRPRIKLGMAVAAMSLIGVVSYCAFLVRAHSNPSLTYYFTGFRFWEIALGSVLAYLESTFPGSLRPRNAVVAALLQILAVLLLAKAVWLDRPSGFPVGTIGIGAVCAVLLILTGSRNTAPIERILSMPILVGTGLISYSLYLWHYPVFLFWRTNLGLDTPIQIFLASLLTTLLALFSYWLIELPLRHSKAPFATVVLPGLLCAIIVVGGSSVWLQRRPGVLYIGSSQQWANDWLPGSEDPYSGSNRIFRSACELHSRSIPSDLPDVCFSTAQSEGFSIARREARGEKILMVAGDSHAYADWGMAISAASMHAFRVATLVHNSCEPGAEPSTRTRSCNDYWDALPALVRRTVRAGDTLLLAVMWHLDLPWRRRAEEAFVNVVRAARDRGAEVIIEAPLPTFERPAYLCTKEWYRSNYAGCFVKRSELERQRSPVMQELRAFAEEHGNVRVWDPLSLLCPTEACGQFQGGKPLFRDTNHLSYFGSKWLAPAFAQFLAVRPVLPSAQSNYNK